MKRTSPSSRLVSRAARSPDLAMTGPDVARKPTPSSREMIWASVVLPRPGGPKNRTWSSASPRAFAAWMKTRRLSRAPFCPTNSSSVRGRSAASTSSGARVGAIRRSVSVIAPDVAARRAGPKPFRLLRPLHQRRARDAAMPGGELGELAIDLGLVLRADGRIDAGRARPDVRERPVRHVMAEEAAEPVPAIAIFPAQFEQGMRRFPREEVAHRIVMAFIGGDMFGLVTVRVIMAEDERPHRTRWMGVER